MKRLLLLSFLGLALAARLTATQIHPVSYVYNQGPYGYWDDTGEQLTDGLYNALIPQTNLGVPNAYNWVGFAGGRPSFTFDFGGTVTVQSVSLSMAKWNPAGVYLPSQVLVNATPFTVNDNAYVDMDHALVTLSGSWTGSSLTVLITPGYEGVWTFIDEVTFAGTTGNAQNSVPETGSTSLLVGTALLGLFAARTRRFRR